MAQIAYIGTADINHKIIRKIIKFLENGRIIRNGIFIGSGCVFPQVSSNDDISPALSEFFCCRLGTIVIESHAVYKGFVNGKAKGSGLSITRLSQGCNRAYLDEGKAKRRKLVKESSIKDNPDAMILLRNSIDD